MNSTKTLHSEALASELFGTKEEIEIDYLRRTGEEDLFLKKCPAFWINMKYLDLRGLNLSGVDFSHINLKGSSLKDVNFSDADLSGAQFRFCDLEGVNFSDARMEGATFAGELTGHFAGTVSEIKFHQAQMNGAQHYRRRRLWALLLKRKYFGEGVAEFNRQFALMPKAFPHYLTN